MSSWAPAQGSCPNVLRPASTQPLNSRPLTQSVFMPAASNSSPGFELKSTALTLVAVILKTTDLALLAQDLDARLSSSPDLFEREPVALDLSAVRDEPEPIDFDALLALLRARQLVPIAAKGGSPQQMQAALAAGLIEGQDSAVRARRQPVTYAPEPDPVV